MNQYKMKLFELISVIQIVLSVLVSDYKQNSYYPFFMSIRNTKRLC
jgi:hypothetical protein